MLIGGAIAWYCSNRDEQNSSSNQDSSDRDNKRRNQCQSGREDEPLSSRMYTIPASYDEVTQNATQTFNQLTSIDVNVSHQVGATAFTEQLAQPSFNPMWHQPSQPESFTILGPNGKRMVYC
jgi:hypothetical protein